MEEIALDIVDVMTHQLDGRLGIPPVVASSLLFGALNSGSTVLQMMTNISRYFVQVLQFTIVLLLAARFSWTWLRVRRKPAMSEPRVAGFRDASASVVSVSSGTPPEIL